MNESGIVLCFCYLSINAHSELLVFGQANSTQSRPIPKSYLASAPNGLVYDASMRYKDFQASGLLVMKNIKRGHYHVAFVSKMSPTIMEFLLTPTTIEWKKTLEGMDRKIVRKLIERDFRLLTLSVLDNPKKIKQIKNHLKEPTYRVRTNTTTKLIIDQDSKVISAETRSLINPVKTFVEYKQYKDSVPNQLTLRHRNIKMRLKLQLLQTNNAGK